jgi:hypothetical protein
MQKKERDPSDLLGPWGLHKPHGASGSTASLRTSTATLNHRNDGNHAGDTDSNLGGKVASDEYVVGGKRKQAGWEPSG